MLSAKGTLYLVPECLLLCMGDERGAFAAASKQFSLLVPSRRLFAVFNVLHVDEHFDRNMRHDDVFEKISPTI